ncbi:MAG: efflux RND transporter permease subunit [Pseudomonadota bacterium]|nr:efflux RND transporter permease subunit [Pseudomonadota bacterium]
MTKIKNLQTNYRKFVLKRPWTLLLISIIFTIVCALGLKGLSQNPDNRIFFSKGDPNLQALETLENTYTKNDNIFILVAPKNNDIFTSDNLKIVRDLTKKLWQTPASSRVDSVTNFQWTRAKGDNIIISDLVSEGSISLDVAENARNVALSEPMLVNLLVSPDSKFTAINVTIIKPDDPVAAGNVVKEVMNFIRPIQKDLKEKYPDVNFYISGGVPLTMAFTEVSLSDMGLLTPLMLLVIFLVAGISLRSLVGSILTAFIVIFSVIGMMGIAGWFKFILNAATFNSFLMLSALTIAHCVHIMSTQKIHMRLGKNRKDAVDESLRVNLQPVFMTAITTAIGFLTMHFSEAPPFRQLGYMMSFGNLVLFFHAVVTLPALLVIIPSKIKATGYSRAENFMSRLSDFVVNNRKILLVSNGLLIVVVSLGITKIKLDDTWTKYFDKRFEIRTHSDFFEDNLTGLNTIEYSIPSGEADGINSPEYWEKLDKLANRIRMEPNVNHVTTVSDTIKRLNKAMNSDVDSYYSIPENRELAAQYLLLYELSVPFGLDLNDRINVDKSSTRLTVNIKNASNDDVRELDAIIQNYFDQEIPEFKTNGTGLSMIFSHFSKRNIDSMLVGTSAALVLISFLLVIALKSFRMGLISLIPNLFPAAVGFGLWGYLFEEVGVALSVVAAMTLGIVVDDTVHYLSKYLRGIREEKLSPEEATKYAFKNVGFALSTTTIALVAGFAILSLSGFKVNSDMALLTAITIAIALFIDLFFLPTLLITLEKFNLLKNSSLQSKIKV